VNNKSHIYADKQQPAVSKTELFAEAQFVAELLKYEFVYKLNPESKEVRAIIKVVVGEDYY